MYANSIKIACTSLIDIFYSSLSMKYMQSAIIFWVHTFCTLDGSKCKPIPVPQIKKKILSLCMKYMVYNSHKDIEKK